VLTTKGWKTESPNARDTLMVLPLYSVLPRPPARATGTVGQSRAIPQDSRGSVGAPARDDAVVHDLAAELADALPLGGHCEAVILSKFLEGTVVAYDDRAAVAYVDQVHHVPLEQRHLRNPALDDGGESRTCKCQPHTARSG